MENLIKMDDLGRKPPIFGNTPIFLFGGSINHPPWNYVRSSWKRPKLKRKGLYFQPSIFQGLLLLVSGRISFRISIVYLTVLWFWTWLQIRFLSEIPGTSNGGMPILIVTPIRILWSMGMLLLMVQNSGQPVQYGKYTSQESQESQFNISLKGFIHLRWCRISAINRMVSLWEGGGSARDRQLVRRCVLCPLHRWRLLHQHHHLHKQRWGEMPVRWKIHWCFFFFTKIDRTVDLWWFHGIDSNGFW